MQINGLNNVKNINYRGFISSSSLYKNYAKEYAKEIKAQDIGWKELRQFINTIRAINNDGSSEEFIIDVIPGVFSEKNWFIKYGNYCSKADSYDSKLYDENSEGTRLLKRDALRKIIEFGKDYFGLRTLKKPIPEFIQADKRLGVASNYYSESRKAKNKPYAARLISMSEIYKNKAESIISEIRKKVIDEL